MLIPISQTGAGFDLDLSPERLLGYIQRALVAALRDPLDHYYPEPKRATARVRGRFDELRRSVSVTRVGTAIHISIDSSYFYLHKAWRVLATPRMILSAVEQALFAYLRDSMT